jgi:DNA-binding transcriptional MerR regulator/effector-binding domain-containing protein
MMHDLIPSGRFAQLARLTRKALRVYAEHGLLRPVHTDAASGYHYYSLSQLEDARRIVYLRELGMSLATIQDTLRVWHTPDVRARLEQHRQHLEQQAAALRDAINELDRLLTVDRPRYTVSTKMVLPQRCLMKRANIPPEETCAFIDNTELVLLETLKLSVAKEAGPLLVRYHESEREDVWDVEVCQPFEGALHVALPTDVAETCLPGGTAVSTMHMGDCDGEFGIQPAYEALWAWVRDHGHNTLGPPYEVYLFDESNTAHPADYRTEVGWLIG